MLAVLITVAITVHAPPRAPDPHLIRVASIPLTGAGAPSNGGGGGGVTAQFFFPTGQDLILVAAID